MSKQSTMTVVGVPSGDMECWCLDVTEQEYRKVRGIDDYRRELKLRKEMADEGETPGPWRLYPQDLIGNDRAKVEIKIKVRRV